MTVEFINKGDIVTIDYHKADNCYYIKAAKELYFKSKEMFTLDTKIEVQCSEYKDICVVGPEGIDKKGLGFANDRYGDDTFDHVITFFGYCYGDEDVIIKPGEKIAYAECYHKTNNEENYILKKERKDKIIYNENGILIKSIDGKDIPYEIIQESNGRVYLRMELSNE